MAGRPAGLDRGFYVEPTVFTDVDNSMRIAQEEIFGPVLAVIPYDGDAEAVGIANDSNYGLCGSVWTQDNDRGLDVARQVRTGTYMLNSRVPIDFATPFGGFKESGVGREFGPEGLETFLEKKSINLPAGLRPPPSSSPGRAVRVIVGRGPFGPLVSSPVGPGSVSDRPAPGRRARDAIGSGPGVASHVWHVVAERGDEVALAHPTAFSEMAVISAFHCRVLRGRVGGEREGQAELVVGLPDSGHRPCSGRGRSASV